MALGFGKALGYALKGTLEGFADVAEKEDEYRQGLTKTTYSSALKRYQELDDLRKERQALIDEEDTAVKAIMNMPIDGKPLTKAEATKVYQTGKALGMDASEVLEKFTIASEESAKVVRVPGSERSILPEKAPVDVAMAGEAQDGSLFSTGRYDQVDEETRRLLQASGISGKVTMPGKSYVEGVTLTPIADVKTDITSEYIVNEDGDVVDQVLVKQTFNNRTQKVTREYLDKTTMKPIQIGQNNKVSSSADAFRPNQKYTDFGPLMRLVDGEPQQVIDENGNVVYGYQMKTGEVRVQRAGQISEEIMENVQVAGKHFSDSVGRGDFSELNRLFKIPAAKQFMENIPTTENNYVVTNRLFGINKDRLKLHEKYGSRMYGPGIVFANIVVAGEKLVTGTVDIVTGLQGMEGASLDEKVAYLESGGRIDELRNIVDQKESLLQKYVGTANEVAMAKVIDSALATVSAYDLAKQTGDTRISNQDFDAYISTVTGNTADQTVELIRKGMERSLQTYTDNYGVLDRSRQRAVVFAPNYKEQFQATMDTMVAPTVFKQDLQQMMKPFDEAGAEVPQITTDDFRVMPVETDAQGTKTRKVIMKDGTEFILRNPRFFDADKATIKLAIQKRLEAQKAANP